MPEININGVRLMVSASDLADARYMRFLRGLDRRQLLRRRLRQQRTRQPSPLEPSNPPLQHR